MTNNIFNLISEKKLSRFGIFSKGFLYLLIGGITILSTLKLGGQVSDKNMAFDFLLNQPAGNIILLGLAAGLFCYTFWRGIQFFPNPESDKWSDRMTNGLSGLFYGLIAFSASLQAFGFVSGDGSKKKRIIETVMDFSFWEYILGAIIIGLLLRAFGQFYLIISGNFFKSMKEAKLGEKGERLIRLLGIAGYSARGIVFSIIVYFYLIALLKEDSSEVGGFQKALKLIQESDYSSILLLIVSFGLISYGAFMIAKSNYREIPNNI